MPEGLFTLLNSPTPEQIRDRIGAVDEQNALNIARLQPGRGQVHAAARAGGHLKRAFQGPTSEEKRAVKLQGVNEEIQSMSEQGQIDTTDAVKVFETYAKLLSKAGLSAEAATFSGQAESMKIKRGEVDAKLKKANANANKPNSPLAKLLADRDAATNPEDRAIFNAAIAKAIENEDSAATIVRRIVNQEKAKHKKSKSTLPFHINRFSQENRVMIEQIQNIHSTSELMGRILSDVTDQMAQDSQATIKLERDSDGQLKIVK